MEVRDFPSIYIFYSVVKIDDCDVWVDVLGGSVCLTAPKHSASHAGVYPTSSAISTCQKTSCSLPDFRWKIYKSCCKIRVNKITYKVCLEIWLLFFQSVYCCYWDRFLGRFCFCLFQENIVISTSGIKHFISSNTQYKTPRVSLKDDHSKLGALNNIMIVSAFEFPVSKYPLYSLYLAWMENWQNEIRLPCLAALIDRE